MEEKLSTRLGEGQIAKLVENDKIEPCQMIGDATLTASAGLGLQPIDQINDIEEAAAAGAN